MVLTPTSDQINQVVCEVTRGVTGSPAIPGGPINSDGYSFSRVNIPATTIGTYDRVLKDRGFHGPADKLNRIVLDRLTEGVEILTHLISAYDRGENQFPHTSPENIDRIYSYPK